MSPAGIGQLSARVGLYELALKGLIFDLDGVLVDTVPAHYAAWHRVFVEYGYDFGPREYREQVDGLRRLEGARAVMCDAPLERVAQAADLKNRYYRELIEQGQFNIFESSVRFVRHCEQRGLGLAAASSSGNVRYIMQKAGILDAFAVVIGGDDVVNGKPNPEIFLAAAKGLGASVRECVVFEDAASGVLAAKRGRFYCVGVRDNDDSDDLALADEIVATLGEIDFERLQSRIDQLSTPPS
jgi:beta-phosphoglucomutase family hydrolase